MSSLFSQDSLIGKPLSSNGRKKPNPVVVDLFCGVGGLTHGLQAKGLKVAAGLDFDESCRHAFEKNNNSKFIHRDIKDVTPQEIADLYPKKSIKVLVGCAPCQPFSQVPGERDDKELKWRLLYSFATLIEGVQPDIVSMENVTQLASHKKGVVLKDFVKKLRDMQYSVTVYSVNAVNYGVPQRRRRLILFASKHGDINLIPPTHIKNNKINTLRTVEDAIGNLPSIIDGEICKTDPLHRSRKLNPINRLRIAATSEGGNWTSWPEELLDGLECRKTADGKKFTSAYGRMSWDAPAPTLTTHCTGISNGKYGHPTQNRAISLREAALLQSFPPDYSFIGEKDVVNVGALSRHIGNAVPPKLGEAIAESILQHISKIAI
jgi:DNA (cytosine-5)-methyltransferase 1